MDLSEQAPGPSGLGRRRPSSPASSTSKRMESRRPSMFCPFPFPAPNDSGSTTDGRMDIDLEREERLSEVSSISLVSTSDESSSEGEEESSRELPDEPSIRLPPIPDATFERSPGAEISVARRLSNSTLWADSPMSDEDESHEPPQSRREGPYGATDDVAIPAPEPMETAPESDEAAVVPRRSVHFEPMTGQALVVEVHRVPTPPAPTAEALRRPHATNVDESRGAISKQPAATRQRSVAVAATSGRSRIPLAPTLRERSPRRRTSQSPPPSSRTSRHPGRRAPSPPPLQKDSSASSETPPGNRGRGALVTRLTAPVRFASPSGRLYTRREYYRQLLRNRWPIQILPHRGPGTEDDGTRRPRKLRGCRFGNLRSIPSNPNLDPPPHTCFNCRRNCKDGKGHKVLECPEVYRLHCENCGRRGVHVLECPRCSEAYIRDGYYLENDWATLDGQPSRCQEPHAASSRKTRDHA